MMPCFHAIGPMVHLFLFPVGKGITVETTALHPTEVCWTISFIKYSSLGRSLHCCDCVQHVINIRTNYSSSVTTRDSAFKLATSVTERETVLIGPMNSTAVSPIFLWCQVFFAVKAISLKSNYCLSFICKHRVWISHLCQSATCRNSFIVKAGICA